MSVIIPRKDSITRGFLSPSPQVELVKSFTTPFQNAMAAARTCYSSNGLITDEQIDERHNDLAKSIYQGGHHTVFTHAYFQFSLDNVSRQFIWSFLHSHPFYNSEQVSQRYVEVKPGNYTIPPLDGEALSLYTKTVDYQIETYKKLTDLLIPAAASEYYKKFRGRVGQKKYKRDIKKKALEIARYVLPVSTFAYMYHTVNGMTLMRYYRLCDLYDVPLEQKIIVSKMVEEMLRVDPLYEVVLEQTIDLEDTPEYAFFADYQEALDSRVRSAFLAEFDCDLEGKISKLIDYKVNNEMVLAASVREVLGVTSEILSDPEAIELVLSPAKNNLLGESLNLTTHSKLTRTMFHPSYTFRKKLSHTADSQDQRHRMTPGSRPCLHAHLTDKPDYITPDLVKIDDVSHKLYREVMEVTWEGIRRLKALGVSGEFAMYLLPNAASIRFTESADLMNLHHKHAMRLCYNAQEEIWQASLEEAQQIREINPLIGKYLLPPCTLRDMAAIRPICPEGTRFCGEKVWRMDISQYERVI